MPDELVRSAGAQSKRPLTAGEHNLLVAIFSLDFPGSRELRNQLGAAFVIRNWSGASPSIDIGVPVDAPRAPVGDGVLPINIDVHNSLGDYVGELIIWISNGALAAVEYAWITDDAPTELPSFGNVTVKRQ